MEEGDTSAVETIVLDNISSIESLVTVAVPALLAIVVVMVGFKYGKRLLNKA
ncbi:hypothetical protein [Halomonas sp. HL-93]|uniref:hypothetical protein n=1 Tax=Halomonas sp. HL-93 TaxID=1666906 RepID=UPI0007F065F2|nr:hypothetical protein [Halomonas sp. HL-93]SBR45131.1 hypothetical protein GA0071314_0087 [Halomonas sp. HL-93]